MEKFMKKIGTMVAKIKYKGLLAASSVASFIMEYVPVCYANGDDVAAQVTEPINNFINVLTSVLAAVGALMLVKNISELSNAIQQQDNSGIFHAGRGIAASLLLISIKLLIVLFGVG